MTTRPTVRSADAYPPESHPGLRNLITNLRVVVAIPMLEELTLDQVVDLWWYAQLQKSERIEWRRELAAQALALAEARAGEVQT